MPYVDEYTLLGLVALGGLLFTLTALWIFVLVNRRWVSMGVLFLVFFATFLFLKPIYYSYRKWDSDFTFLSRLAVYTNDSYLPSLLLEPTLVAVVWLLGFVVVYTIATLSFVRFAHRRGRHTDAGQTDGLLQDSILKFYTAIALVKAQNIFLLIVNALIIVYLYSKYGYLPLVNKGWVSAQEGFVTLLPLSITGTTLLVMTAYATKRRLMRRSIILLFVYVLGTSLIQILMGYREGIIALAIGGITILQLRKRFNMRTIVFGGVVVALLTLSYAIYRQNMSDAGSFLESYSLLDRFSRDLNPYDGYVSAYWYYFDNNLYNGKTIWDLVPFLVPRFVWDTKPSVLGQMRITNDLYPYLARNGIVVTTTLLGELYANWGKAGMLIAAIVLGTIIAWLDAYVETPRTKRVSAVFVFAYIVLTSSMPRLVRTGLFGEGHYFITLFALPFAQLILLGLIVASTNRFSARRFESHP